MRIPRIKSRTRRGKRLSVTARKRSRPRMPTKTLINTSLKVSDGGPDIRHVSLISLLELVLTCRYLLKLSADLQRMFLKLCRECSKRICKSGEGSRCKWWNNRRGGTGAPSPTCIFFRRVLLISIEGATDFSPETSNLRSLRRRVISIPKSRFLFGINRCSENMKSTMSFEILTLMPFKRQ